jgi:hypothetical protein
MTARPLLLASLLAALACGGGGSNLGPDGAAPVEGGGETGGTVPTSCTLAPQAGCAADQQCSVFCDPGLVVACRAEPANAPAIGQPCMNVPCTRGSACMAAAGMPATCLKLCTATADCAAGQSCRDINVTYACATAGSTSIHINACL